MSYLEKKEKRGKNQVYFVKKVSFIEKKKTIKEYIGVDTPTLNKSKYIIDNLERISFKELEFKKQFFKKIQKDISHNPNLPLRIELNSIKIKNLLEAKNCLDAVESNFAEEFIFNSNNIEGSKIPPEKVREIINTGDTKYRNRNEVKEVKNSILAFEYIKKSFKFNLQSIKRLYYILTKDLVMENGQGYPKGFKEIENVVGNSKTTEPEDVEKELKGLIKWYRNHKNKLHPLILAFEFHRIYELIHPFLDGNGRTGRLIMNKILMNAGYFPIIVYKENKGGYFNSIKKSSDGRTKKYYQFMLEQADKSYNFILKVVDKY